MSSVSFLHRTLSLCSPILIKLQIIYLVINFAQETFVSCWKISMHYLPHVRGFPLITFGISLIRDGFQGLCLKHLSPIWNVFFSGLCFRTFDFRNFWGPGFGQVIFCMFCRFKSLVIPEGWALPRFVFVHFTAWWPFLGSEYCPFYLLCAPFLLINQFG